MTDYEDAEDVMDIFEYDEALMKCQAKVERMRAALQAVADWDIDWLDGLDSNVEKIKTLVEAALRGEEEK
jgi:hypothetical protein